ncbi:MAG TPA: hypothetical protein VF134_01805 [Candidatus Dormibacteraeota bacterium]
MQDRDRFDDWLAGELHRELDPVTRSAAPAPRYATLRQGRRWWLLGGAGGALSAKLAGGLVVAAFAVGATGTALSGSPNPANWGSHIREVVEGCQEGRTATDPGIGDCVSTVAKTHGPEVASEARSHHGPNSAPGHGPKPPAPPGRPASTPTPTPTPHGHEATPTPKPSPHEHDNGGAKPTPRAPSHSRAGAGPPVPPHSEGSGD